MEFFFAFTNYFIAATIGFISVAQNHFIILLICKETSRILNIKYLLLLKNLSSCIFVKQETIQIRK
jgi:hypothetical protein